MNAGAKSEITNYADFSKIRYAQCWEDSDILLEALAVKEGGAYLSIASAGDNSLSLLTGNPGAVYAVDMNPAQIHCVELRKAAFANLDYYELLEFLGARPGEHRLGQYRMLRMHLPPESRDYWDTQGAVLREGIIHAGKFESYFRLFRERLLPMVHSRRQVLRLLEQKTEEERRAYYAGTWNNKRWRMMFRLFFSKRVMGKYGRDESFFRYVDVPVAENILSRATYALTRLDTSQNPYLHYILTGTYGETLPHYLRRENYPAIRRNIGRLHTRLCSVEEFLETADQPMDGYNLSDIFEYMSQEAMDDIYRSLVRHASPGCRVAYWNMLVPRSCTLEDLVEPRRALAQRLFFQDKAFFYSNFHVDEVK